MKKFIYFLFILPLFGSSSLLAQNVGIGTTTPLTPLHVIGPAQFDVSSNGGYLLLTTPGAMPGMVIYGNSPNNHRADIARTDNALTFAAHASSGGPPPTKMVLTNDGRLGVGTTTPSTDLQVNGVGLFHAPGSSTGQIYLSSPGSQPGIIFKGNTPDNFRADIARYNSGLWFGVGASATSVGNAMFIDNSKRVGIGTTTPAYRLHVTDRVKFDGATAGMWIEAGTNDWFIGRNSTNGTNLRFYNGGFDWAFLTPSGALDVRRSFVTGTGVVQIRAQDGGNEGGELQLRGAGSKATWHLDNYGGGFRIFSSGVERFKIHSTGKVHIGTDNIPGNHKLYVNGSILSTRVKVAVHATGGWADYVFDESYKLKSLEEVDQYIKTNKHLPNVPSALEMVERGNDLGQTDATLLSKIEELFLHSIEMNKQIKGLQTKVEELEGENQTLKKQLEQLETKE